ncbi:hypothetical protein SprV_0702370300 [Sparganum proliferum]
MAHKPRAIIARAEQDALKKLTADTSIVVLPADKGRSTVVLDKTDYIKKANSLLDNRQAYLRCDVEPMRKLLSQLDKTLAEMQANKVISKSVRLAVKPTNAAAPGFYGLPKVHKVDVPLRPIVSLRGAPTFNLAKWLFRHLRPLTSGATTTVCSATQFLERLRGTRLTADEDLAIETLSELLEREHDETDESVERRHLVQPLKFCLKTYFTFEGTMYEQIKGTPMGSPLSGFIAEAVLQKLESLVFTTRRPKFWTRYVDDTFFIIKRGMIEEFHSVLNSVFPDIQFTMEAENNNQLPFLDVLVHRKPKGHIKTTVYRKATNTRQILSYHSKHPLCHKRSCVRTLYSRAETHCSEPDDRRTELRYLQRLFMANGYPRYFIERSRQSKPGQNRVTEQPKVWRALPYIDGVSDAVSRLLRPLGIGIAHRPDSTIRHLVMRPKAPCHEPIIILTTSSWDQKHKHMRTDAPGAVGPPLGSTRWVISTSSNRSSSVVIINRDRIGEFTQHLNSIFPDIQFTMEEEKDCQLPFLDVLVQRKEDGGLKTTVYRKATNTSRILSFLSNHPLSHKRSCVRTLYRRVETHYTEPADKKAEAQFLRKLFAMNGYPGNFVEKCRRETRGRKPKGQPKPKCWRAVPYIAGLSEEFARLVSEFGIGVAHRPEATIRRQLMQPKDPIPINQKSGVIYRIDCNCGQASYVGETGKQVRTRLREHELAVRRNDKLSLVAAHASTPGHAFDFECVRILGQSDNRVARLLQEAWHSNEDTINRHIDLPIAYQALREQISSAAGGHPRQRGA